MSVFESLDEGEDTLEVELEVELEARDYGWDVVELVQLVREVLVDKRVANFLRLEFGDQFRD